jgi:amidase
MDDDYRLVPFLSTIELAAAIKSRLITSRQVLEVLLARCKRLNDPLNAVIYIDAERARRRADQADAALARGEDWGVLHGVPCTIKENNDWKSSPNTQGDPKWKNRISPRSEVMIDRLEDSGAIIYGKTNLPYHAMDIQSYNDIYGSTSNPWDLTRTPGGSSGGSVVSVACGFSPFELGGDIGGSVRTPAAFCGVYGHKPTFGVIPKAGPNMERKAKEISVRGPFARTADDLRVLMECLSGSHGASARGLKMELPKPTKQSLGEYRVAIWADDAAAPVHDDLVDAAEKVAAAFERSGAKVSRTARPDYDFSTTRENTKVYFMLTAAANTLSDEPPLREVSLKEYRVAQEEREEIRASWERFFQDWDILICPSHCTPAFTKDESEPKRNRLLSQRKNGRDFEIPYYSPLWWAFLTNTGLLPSTTFPAGIGRASGLPIGMNVVSAEYNDYICIDVARLLAKEAGFAFVSPPGYGKRKAGSKL